MSVSVSLIVSFMLSHVFRLSYILGVSYGGSWICGCRCSVRLIYSGGVSWSWSCNCICIYVCSDIVSCSDMWRLSWSGGWSLIVSDRVSGCDSFSFILSTSLSASGVKLYCEFELGC